MSLTSIYTFLALRIVLTRVMIMQVFTYIHAGLVIFYEFGSGPNVTCNQAFEGIINECRTSYSLPNPEESMPFCLRPVTPIFQ